jgi:hypothetical protein
MADNKKNIVGFKKFSDIKKSKIEEVELSSGLTPDSDSDRPMNPNLPLDSKKVEKPASRKGLIPTDQSVELSDYDSSDDSENNYSIDESSEVKTFGKVAKFPKNIKASKAYNFLENVKVSKKSIWYIMVEKQDSELQMVKYNYKEGVDLSKFINELKAYYTSKYSKNRNICKLIENITVDGNDKYSMVKNIPLVEVDGRKMISVITQDLIKLLSR